jgi:GST-like protein
LFESGAVLFYLAEKSGRFLPKDAAHRYETVQWLMFQVGGVGPMFGQVGYFHKFEGRQFEDKRPLQHYVNETRRVLGVLDQRLEGRAWMMGDEYTIADIAIFPMVRNLTGYYAAGGLVGIDDFPNVTRTLETFVARPAVRRGVRIPSS